MITDLLLSLIMPMWKLFYQLSSPKCFYERTANWHVPLALLTMLILCIGVVWGLGFAPPDYQQGDAFRLIYVHVPCAVWSMGLYVTMGCFALMLLIWRVKLAGILLVMTAQTGVWLTFLALVTGSIWGKPMWGTWWVWDARLTSELILLFLYHKEQADKMAAILTLVGLVDLPIIHYSVYWWSTLHQGATLLAWSKPKIHTSMMYPLLLMLVGVGLYSIWLVFYKSRAEILWREHRQDWVKKVIERGVGS